MLISFDFEEQRGSRLMDVSCLKLKSPLITLFLTPVQGKGSLSIVLLFVWCSFGFINDSASLLGWPGLFFRKGITRSEELFLYSFLDNSE